MKRRNLFGYVSVLMTLYLFLTSCNGKLDHLAVNPNVPQQNELTPDLFLPNIIRSAENDMVDQAWSRGNLVVQYTAKRLNTGPDRYVWSGGTGLWSDFYNQLRNVNDIETIAQKKDQPNYEGIALVLKAWMYSILTDTYGEIPYSQALAGQSNQDYHPAFDAQQKVYNGLFSDLEKANQFLNPDSGQVKGDILYNGDVMKWKRFANSLHLRLLMRISDKVDVSSKVAAIVNNPGTYPTFTSNDDNAVLDYLPAYPNQWPLHTSRTGEIDEIRLSSTFDSVLTKWNDPRLQVFFRPTAASADSSKPLYKGLPNGLSDQNAHQYNKDQLSMIGTRYFEDPNTARGLIMTYSELEFILAEAAQRGMISGKASDYYDKGIQASFDFYGVTPPANYMNQAGVAYSASTGLQQIATQKWIALFFNGLQGWFEWRRTGYPHIKPGVDNLNNNIIPVRYQYPNQEQLLNSANYKQAVQAQGPNSIDTKVWWQK